MKQVMYFGPTIPGLIKQNTVFRDGNPERIAKRAEEDKNFSRLLVPVEKAFDARKQLSIDGSVLAASFANVAKNI